MSGPLFLDWNNTGRIDPNDIAVSYALAEDEAENETRQEQNAPPQGNPNAAGCFAVLSVVTFGSIVAIALFAIL